ncbi:MAG TPA: molybdenum cofactor biosynthesis protein MoaE [Gemmatales bacterium]|nr:molybdenum cofactor biosynthesis protein MoaE [Gemmatales bacterium]HMP60541.1 molybdenum cofactor biosynthesis protein MoaE [Gemmatales bacterium]
MAVAEPQVLVRLQTDPIDFTSLVELVRTTAAGAVVLFLGTVREFTGATRTVALEYEAHPELAVKEMKRIAAAAQERWPILAAGLVHRLGRLELGAVSVAVAVSCPHRIDAFAAGSFLIDELKKSVPIWKRDLATDGTSAWIENRPT